MTRNRGIRYRQCLRRCGFRSWKKANARRGELIDRQIYSEISNSEKKELDQLQHLAGLYIRWKCQDQLRDQVRKLRQLEVKLAKSYLTFSGMNQTGKMKMFWPTIP